MKELRKLFGLSTKKNGAAVEKKQEFGGKARSREKSGSPRAEASHGPRVADVGGQSPGVLSRGRASGRGDLTDSAGDGQLGLQGDEEWLAVPGALRGSLAGG